MPNRFAVLEELSSLTDIDESDVESHSEDDDGPDASDDDRPTTPTPLPSTSTSLTNRLLSAIRRRQPPPVKASDQDLGPIEYSEGFDPSPPHIGARRIEIQKKGRADAQLKRGMTMTRRRDDQLAATAQKTDPLPPPD